MAFRLFAGFVATALVISAPGALAQAPGAQNGVPTVTILNKAPAAAEPTAPPTLEVSPQKPGAPQAPGVPAAPSAVATPGVPQAPVAPGSPPAVGAAPSPVAAGAPPEAAPAAAADVAAEPAAAAPPPEPTIGIDIDLTRQEMTVSEHGAPRYTWPISSARYGYRTPIGTFQPTWMTKMWYSRQYDYAPMPHAIFFHQGVAIHATYATRALGMPASHGCVRLAPKHAATLFRLVSDHGKERTQIVVHGRPDHSRAQVAYEDAWRGERDDALRYRRAPSPYRYLPPSYYGRGNAPYAYAPRTRRGYAAPRRPPRGFYSSNSYGYGF